jgi:hypothetical protein
MSWAVPFSCLWVMGPRSAPAGPPTNGSSMSPAAASYDDTVTSRQGVMSVRAVLVHMIEEYAQHNGHADLLRERIDGVTDKE